MASIEIREVKTVEEREAVFNLRYRIYVLERGCAQKYADHTHQRIEEPQDPPAGTGSLETGVILGAFSQNELLGTLRINQVEALGQEYATWYGLSHFRLKNKHKPTATTKFCIEPRSRGTRAALYLVSAAFEYALRRGSVISFLDCNPPLYRMFLKMGFRQAVPDCEHPEYGRVHPMYLLLNDLNHLEKIGSPFLKFRELMNPECESVLYFQALTSNLRPTANCGKEAGRCKMQPYGCERFQTLPF